MRPAPSARRPGRRGRRPGRQGGLREGGDGSGRSGLGQETPPERALRPGQRARQQLWRKEKRRRRRRAAGELWGCGRPPCRSPPSPPQRRQRREAGRPRPPPLSPWDAPRWGRAGSPPGAPANAAGARRLRVSGEEGARQNTGGTQNEGRAQPGARRSLQFKMTALRCGRSCSGSLPGVELLCSVQLPVSLHSCSQEQVTAVGPASFSE